VFANPVAPPKVLPQRNILRLRLVNSSESRVPLSVIAGMCDVSRLSLYRILWLNRVSDEMCERLTPLARAYEAGKLRAKRSHPRDPRGANHWEIGIDTLAGE
jgi:hypothetical protein